MMSKFKVGDWVVVLTRLGFESEDYAPVGHVGRIEFSHVICGDEFWKISGYSGIIAAGHFLNTNGWFRHATPDEIPAQAESIAPSLTVDDLEDGAEYEVTYRGVMGEAGVKISEKVFLQSFLPHATSIRLITPAPVKARPLEVGETVYVGPSKYDATVDHVYAGGVIVACSAGYKEYQPYSNIERESGEPIEESK